MLDVPTLISRAVTSPEQHLGRKSLQLLRSYLSGYDAACGKLIGMRPHDPLDPNYFQKWIEQRIEITREHESRLNALSCVSPFSYAELIAVDDADALDQFAELRKAAIDEVGTGAPQPTNTSQAEIEHKLFDSLPQMQKRPAMYFGNNWSIADVWAYLSGYLWCERDHGIELSDNRRTLNGFQGWLERRYPFGRGRPWDRIIHFLNLGSAQRSFDSFIEHFEMYRDGKSPTAMDPTMQRIVSNIQKHNQREKDA